MCLNYGIFKSVNGAQPITPARVPDLSTSDQAVNTVELGTKSWLYKHPVASLSRTEALPAENKTGG